jgi:phosphate uptake regulator
VETRKIMALGKSSLVISLPKNWLKINDLKRGDIVNLEIQKDLSLHVNPYSQVEKKEKLRVVVIDSDQDVDSITRIIIGCYLNGYNKIQLTSKKFFTLEQQNAIRNIVQSLYLWVIESHASEVILQTLINESLVDLLMGIERMHVITNSMCQDVLEAMKNWDQELASSVISLESDVDQFMFSLNRFIRSAASNPSLASRLGVDTLDCLDYQLLVDRIERVADHLSQIADNIIVLKNDQNEVSSKVWNVLLEASGLAFSAYQTAVEQFLEKSIESSNKVIDEQKNIGELIWSITPLPSTSENDRTIFHSLFVIRDNIRRIGEYAADIAETSIDRAYKPDF